MVTHALKKHMKTHKNYKKIPKIRKKRRKTQKNAGKRRKTQKYTEQQKNPQKSTPLEAPRTSPGHVLVALGRSWALLGRAWNALGGFWEPLGPLLDTSWTQLGIKGSCPPFLELQLGGQNQAKLAPKSIKNRSRKKY